jgi:hypothetical protein
MSDGSPLGIRQCEIFNRTIHALAVSRARLAELRDWEEAQRAGVYILLGKSEDGKPTAYIGEAQRVLDRLLQHLREKDFWNEVILFVNKDENMHAKYIESRLIDDAYAANRYAMENGKTQRLPLLSRADKAAMEEIIPDIRLISGVLGHLLFESIEAQALIAAPVHSSEDTHHQQEARLVGRVFSFSGPTYDATARFTDEGFLILKGSTAAPRFTAGNPGYERIRQRLVEEGILQNQNDRLLFTQDFTANSSSQAAAIVAGGNRSGPAVWTSSGRTLGELESSISLQRIFNVDSEEALKEELSKSALSSKSDSA